MALKTITAKQRQKATSSINRTLITDIINKTIQIGVLTSALMIVPTLATAETFQVVYHVVETGETLSGLADKFEVSIDDLRKLNVISGDNIQAGQRLLIPINKIVTPSSAQSNQSKPNPAKQQSSQSKTANNTTSSANGVANNGKKYKVVYGDTLGGIALKHKVSLTSLLKANNISVDYVVKPNQVLLIPTGETAKTSNTVKTNNTSSSNKTIRQSSAANNASGNSQSSQIALAYRVTHGDTLVKIANAYKVDVADIMEFNGMTNDVIRIGQVLKIPKLKGRSNGYSTNVNKSTVRNRDRGQVITPMTYTVQQGDVLSEIADKHGVSLSQVIKLNNLEGKQDSIKVGQTLTLPSKANSSANAESIESKPRIRDTVNKAIRSPGY